MLLCTLALIVLEWLYVSVFYFAMHRRNFELEFIAFFLSGVGITVIGSIKPDDAFKQLLMLIAGVIGFIVLVFLMGDVDLCMRLRLPVAVAAILLLIVNIAIAKVTHGARNWITIFGVTFQPSEFVKVAFIFVGAATLEKIQTSKNLYAFIAFSLVCVGALIVIKDFGTALIFFVTFLIIAFMNSGDIKTIFLALASAAMGGFIVIKYKSYVTARFSVYRHVWEHYNDSGYQQTRVLVGLASGGLLGAGHRRRHHPRCVGADHRPDFLALFARNGLSFWAAAGAVLCGHRRVCTGKQHCRPLHFLLHRRRGGSGPAAVPNGAEYLWHYRCAAAYRCDPALCEPGRFFHDLLLGSAGLY